MIVRRLSPSLFFVTLSSELDNRSNSTKTPSARCKWSIVSCRHEGSSYLRCIGPQFSIPTNLVIQALAVHAPHYQPFLRLFRGRSSEQLRFHWLQPPRGCTSRTSVASRVRPSLLLGMLFTPAVGHALLPSYIKMLRRQVCHVLFRFLPWPHSAPPWLHTQLPRSWSFSLVPNSCAPQRSARPLQHHLTNNNTTRNTTFVTRLIVANARSGEWSASRSCSVFLFRERAVVWP